ncbi:MAG: DEAD/DEAH box helicase [Vicinamibacterales bacterium]
MGGATPEEISLLEQGPDGEMLVPRGAVALVRQVCAATREPVFFEDRRVSLPSEPLALKLGLRDYQEEAVTALVRNVQGCAVVPCGGGKTVIGTAAAARIGQPTLVVVHTHDLVEQWRCDFRDILAVEAGDLDGDSRMVVATVQSLAAMPAERLAQVGLRFGTVIVDEVHHAPAVRFREVLGAMPGKYRVGLTATPTRADGLTPLVELCIGPIVFRSAAG